MLEIECRYSDLDLHDYDELLSSFLVAIERATFTPPYQTIYYLYKLRYQKEDSRVHNCIKMRKCSDYFRTQLRNFVPSKPKVYAAAIQEMHQLPLCTSPIEKIQCISTSLRHIYLALFQTISAADTISLELLCFNFGVLEILPVLMFVLEASNMKTAFSEVMFIQDQISAYCKNKDQLFYFALFQLAVSITEACREDEETLHDICLRANICSQKHIANTNTKSTEGVK